MTTIYTEQERKAEAVRYVGERINNLRSAIHLCDYYEDIDGNLVYEPGSYPQEKRELQASLREWETLYMLLTGGLPIYFKGA